MLGSMSKIVVIDGLARGGTTLLSSMLGSQQGSHALLGVFHEPLGCDLGLWPTAWALRPEAIEDKVQLSRPFAPPLSIVESGSRAQPLRLNPRRLMSNTQKRVRRKAQYGQISPAAWSSLVRLGRKARSLKDLDTLYQKAAGIAGVDVLSFRWNQGSFWINKFLRREDHFWISVVRHPVARALSAKTTFSWALHDSIAYSKVFAENLGAVRNPRHLIVHFEDLLNRPWPLLGEILRWLGHSVEFMEHDLVKPSGNPYRIESSDIVTSLGSHLQGRTMEGFEAEKATVGYGKLTPAELEGFEGLLAGQEVFQRYRRP